MFVIHVMEAALHNFVDEVQDVREVLLTQVACLLIKGEDLVRSDGDCVCLSIGVRGLEL